ncbi:hypothetical protein BC832DRAFT_594728 [Gaertneriomyces semiglobifer]|nr:hypothetical protein BC832DRAFT_594728 [Gaertneriomyces semiglobifer]
MPAVGAGVRLNQFWQHAGEVNKAYSSGIISDRWYVPNVFSASPRWKPTIDDTPGLLLKCVPEVRYAFMQVNVSLPDVRPQEFLGGGMKTSALRTLPADLQSLPKDQYGMQMSYAMGIRPDDGFSISLLHFHSLATWTSRSSNAVMVTMMAGTLLFDEWVNFAVKDQGGYIREGNVLFRGHTCEIVEAGFEYPWPLRLIQYFDRFITNDVNECSDKYARALPKMLDYSHLNDNQPFQALSETCIGATTLSSTLLTMITNFQEPKPVRITRQHTCVEIRALTFVAFSAPILALIFLLGLVVVGRLPILDQDIDSIPITQLDWAVHSMQEASGKPISKKEIAVLEKPCMMQADKKRYTVWFWTDPNSKSAEKSEDTVEVIEVKS